MKTSDVPKREIGNRIRSLRDVNQYTREELASKANISAKFLYEIENGKKGFSVDILYRFSKLFGVSCDYIIFGTMNDKIPAKTRGLLERFSVGQMKQLQILLEAVLKISGTRSSGTKSSRTKNSGTKSSGKK